MAKILAKLKQSSIRQFLTSVSGGAINKEDWSEIDENDSQFRRYFQTRDDILIKSVDEKIIDSVIPTTSETFKEDAQKKTTKKKKAKSKKVKTENPTE